MIAVKDAIAHFAKKKVEIMYSMMYLSVLLWFFYFL